MAINILLALIALINLFFTLLVYLRNPKNRINSSFAVFIINATFWPLFIMLFRSATNYSSGLLWAKTIYITGSIVPILFLFFSHTITKKPFYLSLRLILISITLYFIGTILGSQLLIQDVTLMAQNNSIVLGPLYVTWMIYYVALMAWGTILLWHKYKAVTGYDKAQLRFILIAILFPTIGGIPFNFILPFFNNFQLIYLGPLFLTAMIATIAYAILKQRFLDIRLVISRSIAFSLLLLTLGFFYVSSILALSTFLFADNHISFEYLLLSTILSVISAITFQPLRQRFENFTNHLFYKEAYISELLLERMGEILRSTLSFHTLLKSVVYELKDTIKSKSTWFIINQKQTDKYDKIGYGEDFSITSHTIFNLKNICQNNSLIIFEELNEGPEKDFLREFNISVLIPLRVKESLHGFMIMREKSSGDIFSDQDINILEILAPQLSIAIQNAKSYEEISQFNQTLKIEIDKATSELKQANQHLKHLDELKDEFVFVATHELKNPVTALRGYLSLLQEGVYGQVPSSFQEPLNQMQSSNQQLVDLVNDLLQIARSETKTVTIKTEPTDIVPIIKSVIQNLNPSAKLKNLNLIYHAENTLPQIKADSQRVTEIMNNLISNAIKYSNKGDIEITHSIEDKFLTTKVKDHGVGISPKDQSKLFTRFFRVEEEVIKGIPGTGLGLFIVKQLIEKMEGTITLDSQKNLGSTFTFRLPLA